MGFRMRCGVGDTCCAVTTTRRIMTRIVEDALAHMAHPDVATCCRRFLAFLHGVIGAGAPPPPDLQSAHVGAGAVDARGGAADGATMNLDLDSLVDRILPPSREGDMHVAVIVQATVDAVVGVLRNGLSEV